MTHLQNVADLSVLAMLLGHDRRMETQTPPAGARAAMAALKQRYQSIGYRASGALPAGELSPEGRSDDLRATLAYLLDAKAIVPVGDHAVQLPEVLRLQVLDDAALAEWHTRARTAIDDNERERIMLSCRQEIQRLVQFAAAAPKSGPLRLDLDECARAAALAGVLARTGFDPEAARVVSTHGGTADAKLRWLTTVEPEAFVSNADLRAALVTYVSTEGARR